MGNTNSELEKRLSQLSDEQRKLLEKKIRDMKEQKKQESENIPKAVPEASIYPLTDTQEAIWLIDQLYLDKGIYNSAGKAVIHGDVDVSILMEAVDKIVAAHTILRTVFREVDGSPMAVVLDDIGFKCDSADVSGLDNPEAELKALTDEYVRRPFELVNGPLLRMLFVRRSSREWCVIVVLHHIISDGISTNVLLGEMIRYYKTFMENKHAEVSVPRIQFSDYAVWLKKQRDKSNLTRNGKTFWEEKLADANYSLDIVRGKNNVEDICREGIRKQFMIDSRLFRKISAYAMKQKVTVFSVLLSSLNLLLYKSCRQSDLICGVALSGRDRAQLKDLIGCFIGVLPVRSRISDSMSIDEYVCGLHGDYLQAYGCRDDYFRLGQKDVCQLMFSYEETPDVEVNYNDIRIEFDEIETGYNRNEFEIELNRKGEEVYGWINYRKNNFDERFVEPFISHYKRIIEAVCDNSRNTVAQLEVADEAEISLIKEINAASGLEPEAGATVDSCFRKSVGLYGDRTAVIANGAEKSYRQLSEEADRVAAYLCSEGVGAGDFVLLIGKRDSLLLTGMLGIIRSGAAYVPVDMNTPVQRICAMIEQCRPKMLLTVGYKNTIDAVRTVELADVLAGEVKEASLPVISPEDPCYMIFTSGSTGVPKGVIIPHRAVVNYCRCAEHNSIAGIICGKCRNIISVTTLSFDIFVTETLLPVLNGLTVIMADEEEQNDSELFGNLVCRYDVDAIQTTPSRMRLFMESPDYERYMGRLKLILLGGEMFDTSVWKKISEVSDAEIVNVYGPTETTVWSSYDVMPEYSDDVCVTIGKPVLNTQLYILNGESLCGIGMTGELCIAGRGVSLGYLNNPELTDERFIRNPFGEGRLYRTGDNARLLEDGRIECLGRMDYQVKIRGYRIETGEIESAIRKDSRIKDVVAVALKDAAGIDVLCAYFSAEEKLDVNALREQLREYLPEYMVPNYMLQMERLPLNTNGKVDRKRLPAPEVMSDSAEYEAPVTETECIVAEIFASVIGIERVGLNDDFFNIGGYSLKAVKVINAISQRLGRKVTLADFFANPTVSGICSVINSTEETGSGLIPKADRKEFYPASSEQSRIYFLHQLDDIGTTYNMPVVYSVRGSFDIEKAEKTLSGLMERHASLRTSFELQEGKVVQRVHPEAEADFTFVSGSTLISDTGILVDSFVKPFDLGRAPLIRMQVVSDAEDHCYVLFDMHHIIADAISVGIIAREFACLYQGLELQELPLDYTDYAEWQHNTAGDGQADFWRNSFEGEIPVLNLPLDYDRPRKQSFSGAHVTRCLDLSKTGRINSYCSDNNITPYMLFMSSLMLMLSRYSGQEDIVVGTTVSGRKHEELENIVGVFINTLPIRGEIDPELTVREFIGRVKSFVIQALDNQEYPFEKILEDVNVQRDISRNPMFDVMLTYNGVQEQKSVYEDIEFTKENISNAIAKLDLNLEITVTDSCYFLSMEYCTALWREESVSRMLDRYEELIYGIIADDSRRLKQLPFILPEEKERLARLNSTEVRLENSELTVAQLFELEADRHPDRTAVYFNGKTLTYARLNEMSNCVAHRLRQLGVERGTRVAVIARRSERLPAGMLGILKAGGSYIPVDPDIPEQRIRYMLSKAECRYAVIYGDGFVTDEVQTINLAEDSLFDDRYTGNPGNVNRPEDVCYTIFTSGTTGNPKGVMLTHRSVRNYCASNSFNIHGGVIDEACRTIISVTTISFDIFVTESWLPLTNGMSVVIADEEQQKNPEALNRLFEAVQIDVIQTTPSRIKMMMMDENNCGFLKQLKVIMLGGEKVDPGLVRSLQEKTDARIADVYGPTETTVWSSYSIVPDNFSGDTLTIGRPIANTQIYILSGEGMVGFDIPGELCIGGDGLAKGYLGDEELTAEKFVSIPGAATKVYRTGDLAKWSSRDEQLYYINRMDNQVKIRGYRIELGEIEKSLEALDSIEQAVAVVREKNSSQYLIAYVKGQEMDSDSIKSELRTHLPEYMVPAKIVYVENFPMNSNGKIDRKKLPEVEINTTHELVQPTSQRDIILVETLKEILGIDHEISMLDNFFELGGDSIKAIQVVTRMSEKGYPIELAKLFGEKNIGMINSGSVEEAEETESVAVEWNGDIPVTGTQDYLLNSLKGDANRLVLPVWFMTESNGQRFDEFALRYTLDEMVFHHDILRSYMNGRRFSTVDSEEDRLYELKVFHIQNLMESEGILDTETGRVRRSFALSRRPLLKAILFKMRDRDRMVIYFNRFLLDWKSSCIFINDFRHVYAQYSENLSRSTVELPSKTAPFADWAEEHRRLEPSVSLTDNPGQALPEAEGASSAERKDIRKTLSQISIAVADEGLRNGLQATADKYNTSEDTLLAAAMRMTLEGRPEAGNMVFVRNRNTEDQDTKERYGNTLGNFDIVCRPEGTDCSDIGKLLTDTGKYIGLSGKEADEVIPEQRSGRADVWFEILDMEMLMPEGGNDGISIDIRTADTEAAGMYAENVFTAVKEEQQIRLILTGRGSTEELQELAGRYAENVNTVVEYCMKNDKQKCTVEDYRVTGDMTAEVLDEIMDLF